MVKKKHYLDIVIVQEKLSNGTPIFVAHCTILDITSQGKTIEEATKNIKEAVDLYLEECPERLEEISTENPPTFSFIEV